MLGLLGGLVKACDPKIGTTDGGTYKHTLRHLHTGSHTRVHTHRVSLGDTHMTPRRTFEKGLLS